MFFSLGVFVVNILSGDFKTGNECDMRSKQGAVLAGRNNKIPAAQIALTI